MKDKLFKRYGNPLGILGTYRLVDLMDFILYLFDTERDERVYNQWLHTTMEQSFNDFKKAQGEQSIRNKKSKQPVTKDEEKRLLDFATQFIKPKKPEESGVN